MFPRNAEVVIIGGGVIGASILYHLSKRKIKAVAVEKNELASGSSGACDGLIFLQSKKPGPHLQLALESKARFEHLQEELDLQLEYRNPGGMIIIEDEDELKVMDSFVEEQRNTGLDVSILDPHEAREMEPSLSEALSGATFSPLDAKINPILLTLAFISSAQRFGSKAFTDCEVTGIEVKSGRVRVVHTTRGKIETSVAVNAAGAHAPSIGKMVNVPIPIKPRRGQLLVTESVPPMVTSGILSARYIVAKFNSTLEKPQKGGISIDQTYNGNLLLGATREFVGFDKRTTYVGIKNIATHTSRVIPQLKDIHIIRAFAGLRPYTPDGLPILGKVEGIKGFVMAAGHEGDGVALSPATGALIAELIDIGSTHIPLDEFALERFHS
ncbi:MAG: FAD-binding oxidoreductase [Deltaproteobacteria bacterium]|nr:MAG: FAD-binding oxidoreductase [Deltaproteobacteria bacterium]